MLDDSSSISSLLATLEKIHTINSSLRSALEDRFQKKKVDKGRLLLEEGSVCTHLWYLKEGLLRSYHTISDKEITSRIMFTGHIVISPGSFFTQTPATESIEALSDCVLASLSYRDLQHIYQKYPEFNLHARVITEQYFYKQEQRLYMLRKHDAALKYTFFLENYADYEALIPQKYLASFLGIAPETFSRLRQKIREK